MYKCIIGKETYSKIQKYLDELKRSREPGNFLNAKLSTVNLKELSTEQFFEILVSTKRPQIFAESAVCGNGLDWNLTELSILGDLGIAVPVTIFDNGQHHCPDVHGIPFEGTLLYIPGALLNSYAETPADWSEVTLNNRINQEAYTRLYERRLLPLLKYANEKAKENNTKAFVTIPGLGCGQFAGPFRGDLGLSLKIALKEIITLHSSDLECIQAIYFDPYQECDNARYEIGGISFLVRPLTKGNYGKTQLSMPCEFNEADDDFSKCELFSIVAWDHVSWPGNDFYSGARATDDGVKAAATDSMYKMTGVEGYYQKNHFKYVPPEEYSCWREAVYKNKLKIKVVDNLLIY